MEHAILVDPGATSYRTVFDVARDGYAVWPFPAVGFLFIVVGVLLVLYRDRLGGRFPARHRAAYAYAYLAFSVLLTIVSFGATFQDYARLRSALVAGRCSIAEGTIADFVPASRGRGRAHDETFRVGNQHFAYSDYVETAGFHQTTIRGGPIRGGLHVRIHHQAGEIARLEIAE